VWKEEEEQVEKVKNKKKNPLKRAAPGATDCPLYSGFRNLAGKLGIWFIPDVRLQAMKLLLPYVRPLKAFWFRTAEENIRLEGIQIQSVRQRFVTNVNVGNLRVIRNCHESIRVPLTGLK